MDRAHEPSDSEDPLWPAVIGGVVGAGIGAIIAGPAGAVLGAAAAPYAQRYLEHVRDEWQKRGELVLTAAEDEAGVNRQTLCERLIEDPELESLMARVATASGSTAFDEKLRGLGRALGRAVAEDGRVDESLCLVAALNDMEAPHVRLLKRLQDPSPSKEQGEPNILGWPRSDLRRIPGLEVVGEALLAVLIRHGLVREVTPGAALSRDADQYAISDLGLLCLALVTATIPPEDE